MSARCCFVFLLAALWTCPRRASAELEVSADVGPTLALPVSGGAAAQGGVTGRLGAAWRFGPGHAVGLRGVLSWVGGLGAGGAAFGRLVFLETATVQPFAGAWAGAGVWSTCIRGDFCGGVGPAGGLDLGARFLTSVDLAVTTELDVSGQAGMSNGVGFILTPRLFVGLSY